MQMVFLAYGKSCIFQYLTAAVMPYDNDGKSLMCFCFYAQPSWS